MSGARNYFWRRLIFASVLAAFLWQTCQLAAQLPVPPELNRGDKYHLIFNSSALTPAASADIEFYNRFVQGVADAAGIGNSQGVTWRAIASTPSIDARDNTAVGANTPIFNTNLEVVGQGFDDLWDGDLEEAIEWDEVGEFNPDDAWTGTRTDGTGAPGLTLGIASGIAWCGRPTFLAEEWLTYLTPPTSMPLHVYAVSEELTVGDEESPPLQAGDADQDLDFDQLDLVQVQIAAKYLTGQAATWGEGDWDDAPRGVPGNPPTGDGFFNQLDIVRAQQAGIYLTGPYAAIRQVGQEQDGQTSIVYSVRTGELSVDTPVGTELTSINIDSTGGIFTGEAAQNLGGSFDNDADNNIFKATFGGSFGTTSFGNVAQTGLSEDFLVNDLTAVGSLAGGGDLGNVDLIYVPESSTMLLLLFGLVSLASGARLKRQRVNNMVSQMVTRARNGA